MKSKNKVAFFDLDYTLINMNSTREFVKFFSKRSLLGLLRFHILMWLFIILRLFGIKKGAKDSLFLLKGASKKNIDSLSERFVKNIVSKRINKKIYDELNLLKSKGYKIIIVSSTISEIAKYFCRDFLIDEYYSSSLRYNKDGTCVGNLANNLEGRKSEIVKKIKCSKKDSIMYTDNLEDIELKSYVGKFIGVSNSFSEKESWKSKGVETLELTKKRMSLLEFIIPSIYYLKHRISLKQLFFQQGIFLAFATWFLEGNLLHLILFWFSYISLYEIGYFINDIYSTKFEKNSRKRVVLPSKKMTFLFVLSHLLFGFLPVLFLSSIILSVKYFIFLNAVTLIIFSVHNLMREKLRLFTYPFLKVSHFIVPLSIFLSLSEIVFILSGLILFYLPKYFIIYYQKKILSKEDNSFNRFLLVAQLFIFLVLAILVDVNSISMIVLIPSFFLLLESINYLRSPKISS